MNQNGKYVAAATAALNANSAALGGNVEGGPSVQLWHLIAALSEWAAVNGINVEAELKGFNATLDGGELDLPAAEAARKTFLESLSSRSNPVKGLPSDFTALISSVLKPGVESFERQRGG